MCYGNAPRSLEIARERMTAEQWAKFEREFEDFCVTSGMVPSEMHGNRAEIASTIAWAEWAFLSARPQSEPILWVSPKIIQALYEQHKPGRAGPVWPYPTEFATVPLYAAPTRPRPEPAQTAELGDPSAWECASPVDEKPHLAFIRHAYFEKVAIASMTDEQAQQSLERWKGETK